MKTYKLKTAHPSTVKAIQFSRDVEFPGLMWFGPEATDGHLMWSYFFPPNSDYQAGVEGAKDDAIDIIAGDWVIFNGEGKPHYKLSNEVFRTLYE